MTPHPAPVLSPDEVRRTENKPENKMNNREVSHLWANQSRPSASGSNFYFEGSTIYSYGQHFPIATIKFLDGKMVALFNPDKCSVTTSKHRTLARSAVHCPIHFLPVAAWDRVTDGQTLADELDSYQTEEERRKERDKAAAKEMARARRERAKLAKMDVAKQTIEWKEGRARYIPAADNGLIPTLLRVNGDYVETSRAARVPVSVARKAWPILLRAASTPGEVGDQLLNLPDFKWGDYTGIEMERTQAGDMLIVGCHRIPFSEVDDIARRLNLI